MSHPISDNTVRPWQAEMRGVLQATYPEGVPANEYESLVYVLSDGMSFRSVAHLLEDCGIRDYAGAYQDVMGIVDRHELYAEKAKPVLEKLIRHGYDPTAE
jgi:hypothetical protein